MLVSTPADCLGSPFIVVSIRKCVSLEGVVCPHTESTLSFFFFDHSHRLCSIHPPNHRFPQQPLHRSHHDRGRPQLSLQRSSSVCQRRPLRVHADQPKPPFRATIQTEWLSANGSSIYRRTERRSQFSHCTDPRIQDPMGWISPERQGEGHPHSAHQNPRPEVKSIHAHSRIPRARSQAPPPSVPLAIMATGLYGTSMTPPRRSIYKRRKPVGGERCQSFMHKRSSKMVGTFFLFPTLSTQRFGISPV